MARVTKFIDTLVIENSPTTPAMAMFRAISGGAFHSEFPFIVTAIATDVSAAASPTAYTTVAAMPVKDAEIRGSVNTLLAFIAEIMSVIGAIARFVYLAAMRAVAMLIPVTDPLLALRAYRARTT